MAAKKAKEVAQNKSLPAEVLEEFEADTGVGQELVGKDDLAIPRVRILQSNSAQCNKADTGKYIKGAEVGDFFNTVDETMYSGEDGIVVIPVTYRRAYIEWTPIDNGGGFVADHGVDESILNQTTKDEKNRDMLENGNQIVTTAEYFAFMVDVKTGAFQPIVITMSSTQLKKSRQLNTMINQYQVKRGSGEGSFNPASFYRAYRLTTIPESNEHNSWFGFKVAPEIDVIQLPDGLETYRAAKAFHQQVQEGAVKASAEEASEAATAESDADPM